MRWMIEAKIVTWSAAGDMFQAEAIDVEVEAISFPMACRAVREAYQSPCASVFIDIKQRERVAA